MENKEKLQEFLNELQSKKYIKSENNMPNLITLNYVIDKIQEILKGGN